MFRPSSPVQALSAVSSYADIETANKSTSWQEEGGNLPTSSSLSLKQSARISTPPPTRRSPQALEKLKKKSQLYLTSLKKHPERSNEMMNKRIDAGTMSYTLLPVQEKQKLVCHDLATIYFGEDDKKRRILSFLSNPQTMENFFQDPLKFEQLESQFFTTLNRTQGYESTILDPDQLGKYISSMAMKLPKKENSEAPKNNQHNIILNTSIHSMAIHIELKNKTEKYGGNYFAVKLYDPNITGNHHRMIFADPCDPTLTKISFSDWIRKPDDDEYLGHSKAKLAAIIRTQIENNDDNDEIDKEKFYTLNRENNPTESNLFLRVSMDFGFDEGIEKVNKELFDKDSKLSQLESDELVNFLTAGVDGYSPALRKIILNRQFTSFPAWGKMIMQLKSADRLTNDDIVKIAIAGQIYEDDGDFINIGPIAEGLATKNTGQSLEAFARELKKFDLTEDQLIQIVSGNLEGDANFLEWEVIRSSHTEVQKSYSKILNIFDISPEGRQKLPAVVD